MQIAGIDLGSRTVKVAVIDADGRLMEARSANTAFDPLGQGQRLLDGLRYDAIQATGYGRSLFQQATGAPVVSEILAHAAGISAWLPGTRAVLDIGGQDTKAISLSPAGKVIKFEMNDRCAAGTGKFLEVMAQAFGMPVDDFGPFAQQGDQPAKISNMCTVFAESEATALVARGVSPANIALGLHLSMARRSAAMLRRVAPEGPVAFSGGVARNACMRQLIEQALGAELALPPQPYLSGAYGAALMLRQTLL